jgi:ATP-binding cassette subfamily B multidrug efflux pump
MNINKLITKFLKSKTKYIVAYIFFMLAFPITSVWLPKCYGDLIESIKEGKDLKLAPIAIVFVVVNVMLITLNKLDSMFIPSLQTYIRENIILIIFEKYKDKYEEQEIGKIISNMVKLPIVIQHLFYQIRTYIIPLIMILIFVVIYFFIVDKRIGTIALTGIVTTISIATPQFFRCIKKSNNYDINNNAVSESISEIFDNMSNIYSSNTLKDELSRLRKQQIQSQHEYNHSFGCTNVLRTTIDVCFTTLMLLIITYTYKLYVKGEIRSTKLINVTITGMFIVSKVSSLSAELSDIVFNLGIYRNINKYVSTIDTDSNNIKELFVKYGEIKYEHVDISYGDVKIINDFNLHVKPGESIGILGNIGSGKSSLVKALLLLKRISNGRITIDNQDINDVDPISLRSNIVYVPQNPTPFNRTLFENIIYSNNNVQKKEVEDLFDKYNLYPFFPNIKLDDVVGTKGSKLSGGQKQIVFLLRLLLGGNKKILLLDEPTSSLDENTMNTVLKLLKVVSTNRTVIIITHDDRIKPILDRVVYL